MIPFSDVILALSGNEITPEVITYEFDHEMESMVSEARI